MDTPYHTHKNDGGVKDSDGSGTATSTTATTSTLLVKLVVKQLKLFTPALNKYV